MYLYNSVSPFFNEFDSSTARIYIFLKQFRVVLKVHLDIAIRNSKHPLELHKRWKLNQIFMSSAYYFSDENLYMMLQYIYIYSFRYKNFIAQ